MRQSEQATLIKQLAMNIAVRRNLRRVRDFYQEPDLLGLRSVVKFNEDEVQSLEVDDMLQTLCHQKKNLNTKRWKQLNQIHEHHQRNLSEYKNFLMVASQANYRKLEHPGYYKQLVKQRENYPNQFFICIEKDIPRTLPDDHPFQPGLRNILCCYAIRNPSLLYCQGMNYIVAYLLINGFGEEEAFWFIVQLIEDIVMPDYFKDLSTISMTVQIFQDVIKQAFPVLANEMEEVGMESGIFLVGWYICLFTKGFINSVSQYLLQKIVLESRYYPIGFILIKISLGILATLFTRQQKFVFQKDFRSLKDSIENNVYEISLQQIKKGFEYFDFKLSFYTSLANIYQAKRQKNFNEALEKQLKQKKLCLPVCDVEFPVCLHRVEIQKKIGTIEEVLILKNNIPISDQYLSEYFPKKVNRGPARIHFQQEKQCTITHHTHICRYSQTLAKQITRPCLKEQQQIYNPMNECESSVEIASRFSKVEDKYSEFSEYFIVDGTENFQRPPQSNLETSLEEKLEPESEKIIEEENWKNQSGIVASVGIVFRKALEGIRLFRSQSTS